MAQYRPELDSLFYRRVSWSVASRLFRFLISYWFVTIPLILVFVQVWLGILAAVACLGVTHLISRAKIDRVNEAMEAFGGYDVYWTYRYILSDWTQTAVNLSLARSLRFQQGAGARVAYGHLSQTDVQKNFTAIAQGTNPDAYEYPQFVGARPVALGVEVRLEMISTQTGEEYQKAAPQLASIWHALLRRAPSSLGEGHTLACHEVRVTFDLQNPHVVILTVVFSDPLELGHEVTVDQAPPASVISTHVGMLETGEPWLFPLDQFSSVVGGVPGGGKSVMLNVLMAGICVLPEIQVVAIDCKGGIEFSDWDPRCAATSFDPTLALEVLQQVNAIGKARNRMLKSSSFKKMIDKGFSVDIPLIVVIVDEAAELFIPESNDKESKVIAAELQTLISRGVRLFRSAGIVFVLATQKPTNDCFPTIIRDNCGNRVTFRTTTPEQSVAILGDSVRSAPFTPQGITLSQKGYAIAGSDSGVLVRARCFNINSKEEAVRLSESTASFMARSTAHLTLPLSRLLPSEDFAVLDVDVEEELPTDSSRSYGTDLWQNRRSELPPAESPGSEDEPPLPDLNK